MVTDDARRLGGVPGITTAGDTKRLRKGLLAVAALAALFTLAACGGGGGGGESASVAIVRQLELLSGGDTGALWDELHPAQQAIVPRDLYVRCAPAIELTDIKAIRERTETAFQIPGTSERVDAVAVTVEFTVAGTKQTETFHEVEVDGKWRWLLSEPEPFSRGECP